MPKKKAKPKAIATPKAIQPIINSSSLLLHENSGSALSYIGSKITNTKRKLTTKDIEVYSRKVSIIRSIIEGIARTVGSLKWSIVSENPGKPAPEFHIKNTKEFFLNPNSNQESFSKLVSKWTKDLLKWDTGICEKVFNGYGDLVEIFARRGAEFEPITDKHGIILGYIQKPEVEPSESVEFSSDEIIYMTLSESTSNPSGDSLLNSIAGEIKIHIYAQNYILSGFTKNEIPPGALLLESEAGSIAKVETDRMQDQHKRRRNEQTQDFEINIIPNVKGKWEQFTRPPKDLQMIELLNNNIDMIMMAFGISPIDLGRMDDANRAGSVVQKAITNSRLIRPISKTIGDYVNTEIIIPHSYKDVRMNFGESDELDTRMQLEKIKSLYPMKLFTVDEARGMIGMPPLTEKQKKEFEDMAAIEANMRKPEINDAQSKEEKESSSNMRGNEGQVQENMGNEGNEGSVGKLLSDAFKEQFERIEKNLAYDLTNEYYGKNHTNNVINDSCNKIFGRFRTELQKAGYNDGVEVVKMFSDSFKSGIKSVMRDFRSDNRTQKVNITKDDRSKLNMFIREKGVKPFYNIIDEMANRIAICNG